MNPRFPVPASAPFILIAEDNEDDLFFSARVLTRAGLPMPRHVEDGAQAIAYLRGEGAFADRGAHPLPDILLLDLKMPGLTGHEVLEWMRRDGGFERIRVCVLTSSDEPRDRQRAARAGALGYLVKPLMSGHVAEILGEESDEPGMSARGLTEAGGTGQRGAVGVMEGWQSGLMLQP